MTAARDPAAEHAPANKVARIAPCWAGLYDEHSDLVQDDDLITSQPWAVDPFADVVVPALGVLTVDEADALVVYHRPRLTPSR